MNYRRYVENIFKQLEAHKATVDALVSSYEAELAQRDSETATMESKYTTEYIDEFRRNWKPKKDYKGLWDKSVERRKAACERWISMAEQEMRQLIVAPASEDLARRISCAKAAGVDFSQTELGALHAACTSYADAQLLNAVAGERKQANGMPRELPLPDVEKMSARLEEVKDSVRLALRYCGENAELFELVESPTNYQTPVIAKASSLGSVKALTAEHETYQAFLKMFDKAQEICDATRIRPRLTDADKTYIDEALPPDTGDKECAVADITARKPEMLAMLLLDGRYKALAEAELAKQEAVLA